MKKSVVKKRFVKAINSIIVYLRKANAKIERERACDALLSRANEICTNDV